MLLTRHPTVDPQAQYQHGMRDNGGKYSTKNESQSKVQLKTEQDVRGRLTNLCDLLVEVIKRVKGFFQLWGPDDMQPSPELSVSAKKTSLTHNGKSDKLSS
jgi:hypothetical protein